MRQRLPVHVAFLERDTRFKMATSFEFRVCNSLYFMMFRHYLREGIPFAIPWDAAWNLPIRMTPRNTHRRPETAAELLDLLLRSRWFADSLFGQLMEQSKDYLDRPAREFAVALVEKRCVSPWLAEELLTGRNRFYRGDFRLIEQVDTQNDSVLFVAEQVRPSRLVLLEVACDPRNSRSDRVFEFDSGTLLSHRIRDRQFDSALIARWREQIATREFRSREAISPDRILVDQENLRCLRPFGRDESPENVAGDPDLRKRTADRFAEFFNQAEDRLASVLGTPASREPIQLHRSRYQPLLRKGPLWSKIVELSAEHRWIPPETPVDIETSTTRETDQDDGKIASPAHRKPRHLRTAKIWLAATLALLAVMSAGWLWRRSISMDLRAGEEHVHGPPTPPPTVR